MKNASVALVFLLLTGCQGYKVEHGKWSLVRYNEGARMVTIVEGVDSASFMPINREYAKDKKDVYWETTIIHGADPSTFVPFGKLYSKDWQKVFWREREIQGADPHTFEIVDGSNLLSKDKTDFYFAELPLRVFDLSSFRPINGGWAKDAKAYYTTPGFSEAGRVDCDYATMKILSEQYAVDGKRAYYYKAPIEGVDVETFRVTGTVEARDKYRKYRGSKVDWIN
jgi:hypothetical protein